MVTEELNGDAHEDRFDDLVAFRNENSVIDQAFGDVALGGGDTNNFALPGFDLLHVGEALAEDLAGGGEEDAGALFANQGDGPVLHFSGWIAFGMDIGNLFQLERTLERDREHQLPAEEEAVFVVRIFLGDCRDLIVLLEDLFDLRGHLLECFNDFNTVAIAEVAEAPQIEREHSANHNLRSEGLGRRDTDFGASVLIDTTVAFTSDGRADTVVDC